MRTKQKNNQTENNFNFSHNNALKVKNILKPLKSKHWIFRILK